MIYEFPVVLVVNGQRHEVVSRPDTNLLLVLRNELGLTAAKYGCGLGECGACTVLVDNKAARSCCLPVRQVGSFSITTLEGLLEGGLPDTVQAAFILEQAAQCGYCLNGMIMTVKALLINVTSPTGRQVREALRYNLCRCGTHVEILRAAYRACGLSTDGSVSSA